VIFDGFRRSLRGEVVSDAIGCSQICERCHFGGMSKDFAPPLLIRCSVDSERVA